MKVYGWEDVGPFRGEMLAANVDADVLNYGLEHTAAHLGWEKAFTSFSAAKSELIRNMEYAAVDADLIEIVKGLKASYVHTVG